MTQTVTINAARSQTHRLLLATGFGGLLFIITYVILGALAPNYNPVRETISGARIHDAELARRINFFVFGLLLCAFAVGFSDFELIVARCEADCLVPVPSGIAVIGTRIRSRTLFILCVT